MLQSKGQRFIYILTNCKDKSHQIGILEYKVLRKEMGFCDYPNTSSNPQKILQLEIFMLKNTFNCKFH